MARQLVLRKTKDGWGIFGGDRMLKFFKKRELAEMFLEDSSTELRYKYILEENKKNKTEKKPIRKGRWVQDLQTGITYETMKDAGKALGLASKIFSEKASLSSEPSEVLIKGRRYLVGPTIFRRL